MFANQYYNGSHIMLLEAKGSKPLDIWDTKKAYIYRVFDKTLKTYVMDLTGNHLNTIKCPAVPAQNLAITYNYVAFQLFLPQNYPLTITLTVLTQQKAKIRLQFSTSIKQIKTSNLLARLPLHAISGTWSLMIFDLYEIVKELFPQTQYYQLNQIEVSPFCTILRVFSLLYPPLPTVELFSPSEEGKLLANRKLPPPPFSRRFHQKLSEKLAAAVPMHCYIIDQFYIFTFSGEAGKDISVRDQAGCIAAREQFDIYINQTLEQEFNVERGVGKVRGVQEAGQEVVYKIYESQPYQIKATTTPRQQAHKDTVAKAPIQVRASKIPTPVAVKAKPLSAVKTALEGFQNAQNRAAYAMEEAYAYVDQINQRNLNENFAAQKQYAIRDNLQKLPYPLRAPDEVECNEDLTISGIAVKVYCMGDGYEDVVLRSKDGRNIGIAKSVAEEPENVPDEPLEEDLFPPEEEALPAEGTYNEEDENMASVVYYKMYPDCANAAGLEASRSYVQELDDGENKAEESSSEAAQRLIPDPADADGLPDPVAFGLYYDPVTKCYYERDDAE